MITLTRRVNESLFINNDIRVTVIQVRNQRVRLRIDAPATVSVRREPDPPELVEAPAGAWRHSDH